MSDSTHFLLSNINYKEIIKKRNANYLELDKHLCKYNIKKFHMQNGPYCYPLYVNNGNLIRNELIKRKIYVPVLWPNVLDLSDCIEKDYVSNILFIPCDQRYNEYDMVYLSKTIIKLIRGFKK